MRLGDVCTIYTGTGFPVRYQGNSQGNYPFYKVGDIAKNVTAGKVYLELCDNYVETDVAKKIKGSILPARTVVFAKIGEAVKLNRRAITSCECLIDNNAMGIAPNEAVLTLDYFYHYMCQLRLETLAEATTVPSVKKSIVENLDIPVPSIVEQQVISKVLNKVSELIALRKEQLAKLDQLVKSRFIELFGDPKLNDKGWKSGIVSDYFEVKGGKRIPKGMGYSDKKTNHPYLRATDMKNETILEDDIHYIDEDVFQHIKRYTVKGGDIYLTNVGVNLGMAGVIPQKFDGASLTENAVKLVPKTEKVIDGLFLAHYINSPGIQEYINERKMSVGVPKLAIFRIETMPLLIPPMDIQHNFNTFVEQTDKSKLAIQQSLDKLELLKKSLMQQYFG